MKMSCINPENKQGLMYNTLDDMPTLKNSRLLGPAMLHKVRKVNIYPLMVPAAPAKSVATRQQMRSLKAIGYVAPFMVRAWEMEENPKIIPWQDSKKIIIQIKIPVRPDTEKLCNNEEIPVEAVMARLPVRPSSRSLNA